MLSRIEPDKLNETLGAIATAFNGRGKKIGEELSDLDQLLAKIEPHLPASLKISISLRMSSARTPIIWISDAPGIRSVGVGLPLPLGKHAVQLYSI